MVEIHLSSGESYQVLVLKNEVLDMLGLKYLLNIQVVVSSRQLNIQV